MSKRNVENQSHLFSEQIIDGAKDVFGQFNVAFHYSLKHPAYGN